MLPGTSTESIPAPHELQQVVDAVPGLFGYVDRSLHLQFCNHAFAAWFGRTSDELRGRHVSSLINGDEYAKVLPYIKAALAGVQQKYEWTKREAGAEERHLVSSYTPSRDAGGRVTGFFILVRDVTKLVASRRELELQRDRLEETVRIRTEELHSANRTLAGQMEVSRAETRVMEMICAGASRRDVLNALADAFENFSQRGMCSVLVVDEQAQRLYRETDGTLPPTFASRLRELPIAERRGSTGTAAFTRQPVYAEDIATDPNWDDYREIALANGIRSSWSAPILSSSGKVYGIFTIYYRDAGHPPRHDEELVKRATHLAAIAFEREEAQARLEYLATHDTLTYLPNRHFFQQILSKAISRAQRANGKFALMFIDLDRFKQVNDELGHEAGDELLKQVAQRLVGTLRAEDTLARLGGDEFVALIENVRQVEDTEAIAAKLNQVLTRRFDLHGKPAEISCSIGIAVYPLHGVDGHTLLKKADVAMYFSKTHGRRHHTTYDASIDMAPESDIGLEAGLRVALERSELVLYYQPKFDASRRKITGAEALVRWKHPSLGMLEADRFISLAEDTGLITEINRWVIAEACRQNKRWFDAGHRLRMAVNMSASHLRQPSFAGFVLELLDTIGLPTELLELELSEGIVVQPDQVSFKNLAELKARGVYVTVDDFGNGYSALSYLKRLPVDGLKIDRSFTQDLPHDRNAASIVEALLGLARGLNLHVTAVGVERPEQISFLSKHGCAHLQGHAISEPISGDGVLSLLESWGALGEGDSFGQS